MRRIEPFILAIAVMFLSAAGCGGGMGVDSVEWIAMGTVARVSFKVGGNRLFGSRDLQGNVCSQVRDAYGKVEEKLSIWNPESEISQYASLDGVSPEMRPCYEAAFELQRRSGGVFNPFWRGGGRGPDLGGIAKGFAVDLAAERLGGQAVADGTAILLDLGGNLKVVAGEWKTGIRNPFGSGGVVQTLTLTNGMACATSGEYERGKHIRDGRTGVPVTNDVASVTVVHPTSAMIADGLSTTLFILGRDAGERFLRIHHPEAAAYWIMRQ